MAEASQGLDLLEEFGRGDALARRESWRYSTNALRALEQQDFVAADAGAELPDALRAQFDWPQTGGRRVVVVNGAVAERYSDIGRVGAAVTVGVSAGNAYSIRIDGDIDEPLHVVYVSLPSAQPSRWQVGIEVTVVNGRARLIEQYLGVEGSAVLGSVRRRFHLADDTRLDLASLAELPDSAATYRLVEARGRR